MGFLGLISKFSFISDCLGNSVVVQWLGLSAVTAGARVWPLVGEPASLKLRGAAARTKQNTQQKATTNV